MCKHHYQIPGPSLCDANNLITRTLSSITAPLRFGGQAPYSSLKELAVNMVPIPQLKFIQTNLEEPTETDALIM